MNSKLMLLVAVAGIVVAGCAQETGAPKTAASAAAAGETAAGTAGGKAADATEAADSARDAADVAARMASADPALGKRQYIYCQACHTAHVGGPNKVGPNLGGVLNRPAAQAGGYVYSAALMDSGIVWNAATLDRWLTSPAKLVPGTTMVFAGINDPQQRANLIAYLQQSSE
jgi:cytochrome c